MNLADYLSSFDVTKSSQSSLTWSKDSIAKRNATMRRNRNEKWRKAFNGEELTARQLSTRVNIDDVSSVNQMMRIFIKDGLVRQCGFNINSRNRKQFIYEWIENESQNQEND